MSAKKIETVVESGTEIFVPLNKLKKSPNNARKMPHSEASIEACAASIAAKGILQNLVIEPEVDADGAATGFYFVTIGEGRRLAQLLRVKRKEIKKTEPIRCVIDTTNDPHEISLDENVTRENMHPADQFEAFKKLAEERGCGAEEIAARFGVTPHVVRQRLRLGAVSPKLMQIYREGDLTLDQLMAFAITEDHARQDAAYERLSYNRDASTIRRMLTEANVAATDRRAIFVGAEAYAEAGGSILRDLFTEDRGGYFEDVALLDRLTMEKLERTATTLREAEGWKWVQAYLDYPHSHGLRRSYPQPVELSADEAAAYDAAQAEYNSLSEQYESAEELPDDVDARCGELETEMERIDAKRQAYDPDNIARGGAFVILNHDGALRVERGFIRPEDAKPETTEANGDGEAGHSVTHDGEIIADRDLDHHGTDADDEDTESDKLSDSLVRDLTAHRTLGLRLALSDQPEVAIVAVTHTLVAQIFYRGADAHVLDLRPISTVLAGHADGIEDTQAGRTWTDRHAGWAAQMPRDVADLWTFIVALDHDSRMALFAHCVAFTVNAVKLPHERKPRTMATADTLADAVSLDMTAHWTPTVRTYLGRVTKAHILAAVREGASDEAAVRMADMKKQAMAEAAEQLLVGTAWLPAMMRTQPVVQASDGQPQAPGVTEGNHAEAYSDAAE
ncbi:ParB/RepB/Spo0J family partition protein [Bradyrhizobium sp. G127]|uniref:ParB/RepB/Spo0J family partition protein n=1 Tax=Bradyrhizobium sp. G127 TaxID=2904800 RepID=UPI001F18DC8F|nr:ParB/RepB/Spo0J family partition protein [Bradyrhizobium sp. G127]MCF2523228.1 ParB N-terminal domain-containing protein [Bradyrhizobium sp. G127]